ncbi:tetratricopeptide repeat protein [Coleofasciculus sp. E2-BRE-01]|uniref:tetratricopeptide repeat protein n=1 Tax=Coleofasciculus sp. E2-BRE-01 TaxID=3069524 RepID=UPI0032F3A466
MELNPNLAKAYNNRGVSYFSIGNINRAIADFQKAADLSRQQGDMTLYQSSLDQIQQLQP